MSSIPKVCSFRGARELVMERVWEKSKRLEEKGIPLSHDLFGRLVREEWKTVKKRLLRFVQLFRMKRFRKFSQSLRLKTLRSWRKQVR